MCCSVFFFFFQAEDGIRDLYVTGVQTCALPIFHLAHEGGVGCGRSCPVIAVEYEGEKIARVKSGIDTLEVQEAAEHQPRANQQHKRERDLRRDYGVTHDAAGAESDVATDTTQHVHQARA